jgi:hypothetical protein
MSLTTSIPPAEIFTSDKVSAIVEYFEEHGKDAEALLTTIHKGGKQRTRNYFYRQGVKVSLGEATPAGRLVICNGFNSTGRIVKRHWENNRNESQRPPDEATIRERLDENGGLQPGESILVKGNTDRAAKLTRKDYGNGAVTVSKRGEFIKLTRKA